MFPLLRSEEDASLQDCHASQAPTAVLHTHTVDYHSLRHTVHIVGALQSGCLSKLPGLVWLLHVSIPSLEFPLKGADGNLIDIALNLEICFKRDNVSKNLGLLLQSSPLVLVFPDFFNQWFVVFSINSQHTIFSLGLYLNTDIFWYCCK